MANKKLDSQKALGSAKQKQSSKKPGLLRLFDKDYTWNDKDEVLDAVYWSRQILAIFMGLIWGFLGLTGFLGIGTFAVINSLAAYAIANNTGYEFEPEENFLSLKEGFATTFATFLVTWIVTHTAFRY